jgi:hypothetical protein
MTTKELITTKSDLCAELTGYPFRNAIVNCFDLQV